MRAWACVAWALLALVWAAGCADEPGEQGGEGGNNASANNAEAPACDARAPVCEPACGAGEVCGADCACEPAPACDPGNPICAPACGEGERCLSDCTCAPASACDPARPVCEPGCGEGERCGRGCECEPASACDPEAPVCEPACGAGEVCGAGCECEPARSCDPEAPVCATACEAGQVCGPECECVEAPCDPDAPVCKPACGVGEFCASSCQCAPIPPEPACDPVAPVCDPPCGQGELCGVDCACQALCDPAEPACDPPCGPGLECAGDCSCRAPVGCDPRRPVCDPPCPSGKICGEACECVAACDPQRPVCDPPCGPTEACGEACICEPRECDPNNPVCQPGCGFGQVCNSACLCEAAPSCDRQDPVCEPGCGVGERCGNDCECHPVNLNLPDLTIDEGAALASVYLDEVDFPANSCAIVEGCVEGPGLRKLLRFSTMTPNIGNADFMLGPPQDHADLFEFSPCHGHYHFNGYANYELLSMDGDVVARGHKQAFCLLDSTRVLSGADIPQFGQFHCGYQGITRGWADIYGANLDCQWVDVTEVPPGAYKLRMSVNTGRTIEELSYDNNSIEIPVLIPRNDPLAPCDLSPDALGEYRDCGWELDGSRTCNPGEPVAVGCAVQCQLGSCEGDPVLRVCEGEDNACPAVRALGNADNACGGQCPVVNFTCPQSGRYTVLRGASEPEGAYACEVAAQTGFILADPRDSCGQRETGLGRDCGWDDSGAWLCEPGTQVRLGCAAAGACALGSCTGDSMLRLCDGHDNPCTGDRSLQQNDDACGGYCSLIDFVCPDSGVVTALTAPYTSGNEYGCELEMDGGQRCPVDAFEPNSDPRFAPLLTEGSHEPLTLCRGEAENYIIFANEPDTIRLDFHFDSPDAEVKLQLFDPDGRLLQEGAGAAPSVHMAYEVDVPGRYRLTAELLRGGWIGYSVDLSLYEP